MFMILVYGYMRHLYSSGETEEACRTDIRFMWISGPADAPDHSTIARFQNDRLVPVTEDLFYQLTEKLTELNEISYSNVFVDGTKTEDRTVNRRSGIGNGFRFFCDKFLFEARSTSTCHFLFFFIPRKGGSHETQHIHSLCRKFAKKQKNPAFFVDFYYIRCYYIFLQRY